LLFPFSADPWLWGRPPRQKITEANGSDLFAS
jgi:hypothetical protein